MAYWKENINVEVMIPYITQGCTIGRLTAKLSITPSDIWFSGNDCDSRVWKAYISWGDYPILIIGKATNTPGHGDQATTYKVTAWCSCDGMTSGKEQYKTKVLSYN